jgi:hypothetical protein
LLSGNAPRFNRQVLGSNFDRDTSYPDWDSNGFPQPHHNTFKGVTDTTFYNIFSSPFTNHLLATSFTLISCLAYSSALKMETVCSSETSIDFKQTT